MEGPSQKSSPIRLHSAEGELLDSWKGIAAYLRRSERTVRRWEATEGLPVHRHLHRKRGTVFGYRSEVDAWWQQRGSRLADAGPTTEAAGDDRQRLQLFRRLSPPRLFLIALAVVAALSAGFVLKTRRGEHSAFRSRIESLAVLPLRNVSGEPAQEYFADGMTDALIAELTRIPQLKVISRTSVMRYKNLDTPIAKIAAELGVEGVIEGSAVREGNRVRITVQVIDGITARKLWSNTYESEAPSVLALQNEAARGIAEGIRARLPPARPSGSTNARPVKPEAHDAYLRGLFLLDRTNRDTTLQAIEQFRRSIALDPDYAAAHVGLADAYNRAAIRGYLAPRDTYAIAKAVASRAALLDDTSADAHTLLGVIGYRWDWDWSAAELELKRALALEPGSSRVRLGYGTYLLARGAFAQAVEQATRAIELDPLSLQRSIDLVWKLSYANEHEAAFERLQNTLAMSPDFALGLSTRASLYITLNKRTEAVADCVRALHLASEDQWVLADCGRVYAFAGMPREATQVLERFKAISSHAYLDAYRVAQVYSGLGKADEVDRWLERAYAERSVNLCQLGADVQRGTFVATPHTRDVLQRINLAAVDGNGHWATR